MKKITLSLFAAACSLSSGFSQVVLQEDFTSPFNPVTAGWTVQNESTPIGVIDWFQGNGAGVFPAYNGGPNDYYGANFNNTTSLTATTGGDISNWLITPVVTIYDGALLQFATRQSTAAIAADRLQVRMSTAGASASITPGVGSTGVGTFTDVLLDINPNLILNNTSVVSSGSVNGYPTAWTVFSVQISGVTGTVTGKFAFRYFVTNGGITGANSDYIGFDAVKYTLPCGPTVQSFTTCVGANSTTLNAIGGTPATTYSWSPGGGTGSSIVVNPSATQVYTLYPSVNGSLCPTPVEATVTVAAALGVNVASSASTICSGNTVTLTATSSASTYSWSNGATTAVITVTPNNTTTYSVGAISGLCVGGNTITINVNASPTLTYAVNPFPICVGVTNVTVSTLGASTYTYDLGGGNTFSNNPLAITVPTVAGSYPLGISGTAANGCISGGNAFIVVNPNPTVTVTSSLVECVNSTVSLTASGASTYSWSGAGTGTTNPLSSPTGSTAVVRTYTVVGTATTGCSSAPAVRTITISACTGIENIFGNNVETSVFPNPFTNELQVSGLDGYVKVYNALGQLVFSTKVYDTTTINTSEYSKGVYILKAYTNQGTELKTTKLIKN